MSPVTTLFGTADPDELREVAALADAGPSPELSRRLAALPRCALTPQTLASPPDVIARHARMTALYLELRRDGVPFNSPEAHAAYARFRAAWGEPAGDVTAHEVVIRLGRPCDLQLRGTRTGASPAFSVGVTEIMIPFGDRESAEAAQREIEIFVRAVHDAGGEDCRPAVAGEVVRAEADGRFAEDLARAVREQRAREAPGGNAGA